VNAVFSTASRSLQYLDAPARFAAFWVHDPADLQPWERAAPLRALLAGWARAAGGFLIHGAGVGVGGQGVLLTGASGSGKSTTALACLVAGMDFAGDDFVMLRRAPGAGAAHGVQLHGLFGSAKVAASELDRPGDQGLAPLALLAPPRDPTDADGGKAILWINESHPASMARHLAVRAVIVPVPAAHAQPRLRPASPVEVLRALLPSSAFLSAGAERRSYAGAIDLVRGLPALVLELGRRRADNAQVIQRWLQVG
jgi:hypothetical protein